MQITTTTTTTTTTLEMQSQRRVPMDEQPAHLHFDEAMTRPGGMGVSETTRRC
jgi:hypothetical protein